MYKWIKSASAMILAATLSLPCVAFAEEEFTFDGVSATGTVQELWYTLKTKGYDCSKYTSLSRGVSTPDNPSLLPPEIANPDKKYAEWDLKGTLTGNYLMEVETKTSDLGGVAIEIQAYAEGDGKPESNTTKVCGLRIRGKTFGKDVLAAFTQRYGEPKTTVKEKKEITASDIQAMIANRGPTRNAPESTHLWEGKTQRAYLEVYDDVSILYIQNIAEFNAVVQKMLTNLDNKLVEQEKKKNALEEQKKSRI